MREVKIENGRFVRDAARDARPAAPRDTEFGLATTVVSGDPAAQGAWWTESRLGASGLTGRPVAGLDAHSGHGGWTLASASSM